MVIAHLSLGQQHDNRPTITITDRMKFRVQPALGSSNASGNSPFFKRLAAVR